MPSQARDRSVSNDFDGDSDLESNFAGDLDGDGGSAPAGKPGRKKNPNSAAARRDQNRIAQREFRLRKQQRIRDLEASVEILSGGKDEALNQLRKIMKDLMHENQVLRQLLKSLSSFIGDGAGGLLPKLGWDLNDFNNFVNRSETDTAWESYQRHKREDSQPSSSSAGPSSTANKRASDEDPNTRAKRPRMPGEQNGDGEREGYPLLVPVNPSVPPLPANGLYPPPPPSGRAQHEAQALFEDLMRPAGSSSLYRPPGSPANSSNFATPPNTVGPGHSPYQPSYMQPMGVNVDPSLSGGLSLVTNPATMPAPRPSSGVTPQSAKAPPTAPSPAEDDQDPKRHEAYKLIQYHLDNYKRNSAYCLPSSLRPTLVQRTVPHESVIDGILHPELRDRMILLRGRFDLVDCLHDYRTAITIHGDDVLAHANWEISEQWLSRYKFLVDPATLNVVNRWRRERGESELRAQDYVTQEGAPTA